MKYQESFRAKTWYLHMWKYHLCYGFIINFTFQTKKLFQVAWRYEISLLVLKKYFTCSLRSLVTYFSTLEEKFRIPALPCNILYINNKKKQNKKNKQNETKIKQTNKQKKIMPVNFLEISRYVLTSYYNKIVQSNNASSRSLVFFGRKTKSPCSDLFTHWLIKQITNTYRKHVSKSRKLALAIQITN